MPVHERVLENIIDFEKIAMGSALYLGAGDVRAQRGREDGFLHRRV